jgi:hypothetical protein
MKCPRCVQRVHKRARQCPHCGFSISDVDRVFGEDDVRLRTLTDAAGVLRKRERLALRRTLRDFQTIFPQLFFGVYFGTFHEVSSLREFGFWLLNRGAFEDVDVSRPNEGGVLLSVDVGGKAAGITYGYALQPFLSDETTFRAISAAHPYFIEGQWLKASEMVVSKLAKELRKQARRARRDPDDFQDGANTDGPSDFLQRIRASHRGGRRRTQA